MWEIEPPSPPSRNRERHRYATVPAGRGWPASDAGKRQTIADRAKENTLNTTVLENIQSELERSACDAFLLTGADNIRKAAEAKVENGTLTVTDMLREITAENLARQTKALHEVQLLMNIWNLKYTLNN